ncbi:PPOX class F420-dependent oxidoreductase [Gordonia sputi]|uniref:PPOX class F420-dependent oxidoreductase n=1 Tax=Gordonia sputi TaxID=36823 RepID=UPI00204384EB|nr:PPOX class F420-dependent oxidoreductase [Gordonia sputi]MCM3898083.1 PPOX class F420-dependent oxidoreductase [Gordonia sputi]
MTHPQPVQPLDNLIVELARAPQIATIGTIEPDGSPQLSPVWITNDGTALLFSTVVGRRKHANILRDNRISISITDTHNPQRRVEVRGGATIGPDPEGQLINTLSRAYTNQPWVESTTKAKRVVIHLIPEHTVLRP